MTPQEATPTQLLLTQSPTTRKKSLVENLTIGAQKLLDASPGFLRPSWEAIEDEATRDAAKLPLPRSAPGSAGSQGSNITMLGDNTTARRTANKLVHQNAAASTTATSYQPLLAQPLPPSAPSLRGGPPFLEPRYAPPDTTYVDLLAKAEEAAAKQERDGIMSSSQMSLGALHYKQVWFMFGIN
jgi:hypothetical protein